LAYFGGVECQQASFASSEEDFKSTVSKKVPLLMKLSNLLVWQRHEEYVTVSKESLLLIQ